MIDAFQYFAITLLRKIIVHTTDFTGNQIFYSINIENRGIELKIKSTK